MGPLDGSIVNIALPAISAEFNAALTAVEWVVMSYLLTTSSTLLIYGRMGDLYGQQRIYVTGFVIFVIGSLLCSLATSLGALVAYRVLQALGAGMMISMSAAIITRVFPARERGTALGIQSMVVAVGLVAGPTLGGFLVEGIGWRSIFWINVPIGIAAILWAARIIPESARRGNERFDLAGALCFTTSLTSLLLIASRGPSWGWGSPAVISLALVSVATAVLFIRTELTVDSPMVDLTLFRNRVFVSAAGACLLNFMSQFSVTFLMPFYLQNALHYSARDAGLILSTVPIMLMVLGPVSGAMSDRYGSAWLSPMGMTITAVGVWLLAQLDIDSSTGQIIAYLLVFGLGAAIFGPPNNSTLMGAAPPGQTGMASGILAMMRNMGMVLGIAISGAVVDVRLPVYTGDDSSLASISQVDPAAFVLAQQDALLVGAALAGLGIITSLVRAQGPGRVRV